eukprot:TRINITY_DN1954_c0_g1_i1.p1 TRINITY_DN1954_c0_g1~~TRINITY_DN1954_c0_g1_i1.p1  ORF type:complete len:322 (-),score=121.47 TRINITY_DN1954_c0_g1_i1:120-1085(-)
MSLALQQKKKKEGDKHYINGDKCLETSWISLKFKPDWSGGALEYDRAATAFQVGKLYPQAVKAFLRSAECYENLNLPFSQGKKLQSAGQNVLKQKDKEKLKFASELFEKAADCFSVAGKQVAAADTLFLASESIKDIDPDKAITLIESSIERLEIAGKFNDAVKKMDLLTGILLNENKFQQTIDTFERKIEFYKELKQDHNVSYSFLYIIIIHLAQSDLVKAERVLNQAGGDNPAFFNSDSYKLAVSLVDAVKINDIDLVKDTIKSKMYLIRDSSIGKLVQRNILKSSSLGFSGNNNNNENFGDDFGDDFEEVDEEDDDLT